MQRQTRAFRASLAFRPLQSVSPTCSYVLTGGGPAVLIQHQILLCLYDKDGENRDLVELGRSAPALQLVTQSWTQVNTPSVSSEQADHGFFNLQN